MADNSAAPNTVPVIAPDGTKWDIPHDQVPSAVQNGGKLGVDMVGPDDKPYLIPMDNVHSAIASGGRLAPPPLTGPNPDMQTSTLGTIYDRVVNGPSGANGGPLPNPKIAGTTSIAEGVSRDTIPNRVATGALKGGLQTAHTLLVPAGKVVQAATGSTSLPTSFKQPSSLEPEGTAENIGAGAEGIMEFMAGDGALKGLSLAEKLGLGAKIAKIAEESPAAGKIIQAGLNALRMGAVSGAQSGLHDASAASVETGAAFGAGGELAGEAAGFGASKLFPRTAEAAEQAAAKNVSELASQRQVAAKSVGNMAAESVTNATGKSGSTASDFKTAAEQIKQNFNPVYDGLRESTGGVRNSTGRFGPNAFDDASNQVARAKKVLFSASPASTDALKQAETELAEGEAKLQKIFDSGSGSQSDLAEAKQAWANASTLEDLHGQIDKAFTEPAGIRNLSGSKVADIDPRKYVQRANRALDEIGADKLKSALGENTFSNFLAVRQGLNALVEDANYGKSLDKAAKAYLKQQGVSSSASKTLGGPVAGTSTGLLLHLVGASNPLTAGAAGTVGLVHYLYSHPDAGIRILRLTQKAAPVAAQAAKQVVTHVFNPESGEVEEQ